MCLGELFRDQGSFLAGVLEQAFGLLVVGVLTAYVSTLVLRISLPGVPTTQKNPLPL